MTAEQTFKRVIFALAALQERAELQDIARATAVMALRDGTERVRAVCPAMAGQMFGNERSAP